MTKLHGAVLAGFGRRLSAGLIDHGLFFAIAVAVAVIHVVSLLVGMTGFDTTVTDSYYVYSVSGGLSAFPLSFAWVNAWTQIAVLVFVLIWPPWFIGNIVLLQGLTGRSVGKRLFGLRLVDEASGKPPALGRNTLRALAHAVDSALLLVGYVLPLVTAKRQTVADMVCNTVVVRHDRRLTATDSSWSA